MNNSGEKIGIFGIAMNFLIAVPKMILGTITQSLSLFIDGVNNAIDSITGVVTYVGVRISKKPRDADHPYGHGRAEYIAGFLITLFTAVVGVQFFISSVKNLINPKAPDLNTIARVFLIITIFLKLIFAYVNNVAFKKYHATIFKANRQDALMDIFSSTFILISSFFFQGHAWLDSILGLLISILILFQAWETLQDTIRPLIGPSPSEADINKIASALHSSSLIDNVHNIYVDRYSMGKVMATADVEVNPDLSIVEIHDEIERLTIELKKDSNIELVVHVEPMIVDEKRLAIKQKLEKIPGVISVHDLLLKNENYVTLAISIEQLEKKEKILKDALEILEKEDDKKWNIDTIVSFKIK